MKVVFQRIMIFALMLIMIASCLPPIQVNAVYGNGYAGGRMGDGVGIYAHGVDLSEWQGGEVDFHKIKEQGYSFVILRAGFSVYIDEYFERNYAAAKEAGLHVGVYLYSYADTVEEVLREAEALKSWLDGKTLEYPVYYDMEEPETHGKMSASALTELSMSFLDSMAEDGWLVGLYSCKSWLDSKLETDRICAQYECWMALYLPSGSYATYDRYDEYCGMWQYSSTGKVDGVPGNVDMNVAFKDYPNICMQYGLNGYSASGSVFELTGYQQIPNVIACGESIPVSGRVVSNEGALSSVTVAVYNTQGEQVTGRSAGARGDSYDIAELAVGVKVSLLPEGSYIYRVTATNTSRTRILLQQPLHITQAGILARDIAIPENHAEGERFEPKGTIEASTDLKSVELAVLNQTGAVITRAESAPKTKEYDLSAMKLDISSLKMGEYIYRITVVSQKGTQVIEEALFSVWVINDPIIIQNFTLKSEYHIDDTPLVDGRVISTNSDLHLVMIMVTDASGTEVAMVSVEQCGKDLYLSELNDELSLQTLSYGSYICTVTAVNDAGPKVLAEKSFVIRPDGLSLCELKVPSVLTVHDSFLVGGAIASDDSVIDLVSISVLDESLQVALDVAVVPNVYAYNLSDISPKLCFSNLECGEYTLRICASNGSSTEVLYNGSFSVVDHMDLIEWSQPYSSANGIAWSGLDTPHFSGTLSSRQSAIVQISAEVYSEDGSLVSGGELFPTENDADISKFNDILRISALSEGDYRLVITAENESGSYIMQDECFAITSCVHSNVRAGVLWEQRCDRIGAVCASRCADCGRRVQHGLLLQADEHQWTDDSCRYCGQTKMNNYTLSACSSIRQNGRYLVAAFDSGRWYALMPNGAATQISGPDVDGTISASAGLLWTAFIRGGKTSLRTADGRSLQLDSEGVVVSYGYNNAFFDIAFLQDSCSIDLQYAGRQLCFEDGCFTVDSGLTRIILFELK